MATITFPAVTPTTIPAVAVYTRQNWADAWTLQASLHPTRFSFATGETISSADFHYRFGQTIPPGGAAWVTSPVAVIDPRCWVRIVAAGTGGRAGFEWVGVWRRAEKHPTRQRFSAVGLEWLLTEQPCLDSPWWDGTNVQWAGRGLEFNAGGLPNRSAIKYTVDGQTCYVFDADGTDYWSTRDAVEMLLAVAAPVDGANNILWTFSPAGLTNLPNFDRVSLATDGRKFSDLFRALITRHHLVTWRVFATTVAGTTTVYFSVHSFAETAIDLHDMAGNTVGTIPANAAADTIVNAADQSGQSTLTTEATHVADQVIVTGNRREVVFSICNAEGSLDKLWSDAQEVQYLDGASKAADYPPAAEVAERERRDADARVNERLAPVFAWFGPPDDWDQTASGGADHDDLADIATDDVDDPASAQFLIYPPALRFAEYLPLLTHYDHTGTEISSREADAGYHAKDLSPSGVTLSHERVPLLVFVQIETDRWQRVDRMARAAVVEQTDAGLNRHWSAHPKPLTESLGFEIRVQDGEQHVLAWAETIGQALAIAGAVRWTDDVIATVCIEDPRPCEVRYPADEDLTPLGEVPNRLRIDAPGRRLVYVLPNTVVECDRETGELLRTDGGTLIDDRPEMFLIAQRCYQWHRVPRYALQLTTGWIDGAVQVGRLITAITDSAGTWPVLSVVTELTVEFPVSEGPAAQPPRMSFVTAFAELDPLFR